MLFIKKASELSQGMQQHWYCKSILLVKPKVLLLDEPFEC
jgi:ABC-type Fe3+/spermidine/putrescine transport system ATPase subunit